MPYYTTLAGAIAAAQGIKAYREAAISKCAPLQDYFGGARLNRLGARRATLHLTMVQPARGLGPAAAVAFVL